MQVALCHAVTSAWSRTTVKSNGVYTLYLYSLKYSLVQVSSDYAMTSAQLRTSVKLNGVYMLYLYSFKYFLI